MFTLFDPMGTEGELEAKLEEVSAYSDVTAIMVLACDANNFKKASLDPILLKCSKPIFGGIFPQIIQNKEKFDHGTLIIGLTSPVKTCIIPGLSSADTDFEEFLESNIPVGIDPKTMFVFVDGFGQRISALIESLFSFFGLETSYLGGGAGSLSFIQKPVLITNEGLLEDAAVLALTEYESGIGVSHGWKAIGGPYRVSLSERNKIISLDWKPAFETYKEVVEGHSGKQFAEYDFFDIAKAYPFGISKLGGEKIVRDPLSVAEDGSLTCVGEVPQDIFVHILNGDTTSLVNAAADALDQSLANRGQQNKQDFIFVADCISRVLFLDDEFELELEALSTSGLPLLGALTLGEIANSGQEYLEFYNKTSVVGVLGS